MSWLKKLNACQHAKYSEATDSGELTLHHSSGMVNSSNFLFVFDRIQHIMFSIKTLPEFSDWLSNIKDGMTLRRLARRLEKAQLGNLGDVKPVGDGVWEMREFFGPG